MIRRLKSKDKISFIDYYQNFYQNPLQRFWNIIKRSGICYVIDNGKIDGILLIDKKDNKKFLQICVNDTRNAYYLLKNFLWNHNFELFLELNNEHILNRLISKFKFYPIEKNEKSTIYCRKPWRKDLEQNGNNNYKQHYNKDSWSNKRP
jgi:hypothetical protein